MTSYCILELTILLQEIRTSCIFLHVECLVVGMHMHDFMPFCHVTWREVTINTMTEHHIGGGEISLMRNKCNRVYVEL